MEHSKLPWKAVECTIEDANGVEVVGYTEYEGDVPVLKHNAEFIVRAVNSQAELVAAAEEMLSIIENEVPHWAFDEIERLQAAVAKARANQ